MNSNYILAGCIGFLIGGASCGVAAHFLTKRKYKKIIDETVDSYEKLLGTSSLVANVPEKYRRKNRIGSVKIDISEENKEEEELPKISKEDAAKIKEKLQYNNTMTTNYAAKYRIPVQDLIDEQAESEKTNIFDAVAKNDGELEEDAEEETDRAPVIISEEDYNDICDNHLGELPGEWDANNLFLYNDGTVTGEDDHVYEGAELKKMIGNSLDKYGFRDSKEKTIFVKSFALNTVYEIVKINKPFVK